ncbi:homoserine kinase [Mesorhizobium sp. NBSH29]|uniref:homoserine kinase n=1 Tax=Mesorhizobium sp. NBSH29 TaxID=2654249 RepID=UPI0018963ED6|nr:homoserine kinase [Mesorhizobium sp. NBSH29]QPC87024.1 homoserine kinase [Mesorhizobium sp. NBSH29]
MAVYTDIAEGELSAFLQHYDVGDLLSYKGIAEGVENSNFLLHTTSGPYILTLYEKRVDRGDLPFFINLMQHLHASGISCPQPVAQRHGKTIDTLADRPAAIVTFLEGMWMRRPTVDHCRSVGAALAALHLAGTSFGMQRQNALSVAGWRPLWNRASRRAGEVEPGLGAEVETDLTVLENNWPKDLPSGVIHADLFPDNVFFLGGELSGVIDFYFACTDQLAYDVAVCLNAWCFEKDHSFNLTKGKALLSGYTSVKLLSQAEADALPLLAHGAALRFFLTRLYDWQTVPEGSLVVKKDPLEYLRRMRFHRRIVSAAEYGLGAEGVSV